MNHPNFKSFEFAEAICNGVSWNAYEEFEAYLLNGGNINEVDRDGTSALEIAQIEMASRTSRERATALNIWLKSRGAK